MKGENRGAWLRWEDWADRAGKEKARVCGDRKRRGGNALKMNFSVGVNMYKLNVTSYWYRLRWSQRNVEASMDIVTELCSRISSG